VHTRFGGGDLLKSRSVDWSALGQLQTVVAGRGRLRPTRTTALSAKPAPVVRSPVRLGDFDSVTDIDIVLSRVVGGNFEDVFGGAAERPVVVDLGVVDRCDLACGVDKAISIGNAISRIT